MDGLDGRPQDYLGSVVTIFVAEISNDDPHRKQRDPDKDLTQYVMDGGSIKPLLVTRSPAGRLLLVGGERRYNALKAAGRLKVKAYVAHNLNALLAWLDLDSDPAIDRRMARSEVAAFSVKCHFLLRIIGREIGKLDRALSVVHDYTPKVIADTRQVVNRLNSTRPGLERERIADDLDQVDEGVLTPSGAISRCVLRLKAAQYVASAMPAAQQAQAFKRVLPGLRGTVEGLRAMGAVSGDIPEDIRVQAEKELREAYLLLARITKDLKTIREKDRHE